MAARGQSGQGSATERLQELKLAFPCREQAIDLLAAELMRRDRPGAAGTCRLVYGQHATGKTAVVRGLLSALRLRHAYVNCHESSRVRPLLSSLLHQLKGGKRQRDDAYECGAKCDSLADFRLQLPGVVGQRRGPCWLVLDNAQRLAGSELLAGVMRVREDTGAQILERRQRAAGVCEGEAPAYRQFLTAFVPTFCRISNNLLDLQAAAAQLFPLYVQPLREGRQMQSRQLHARISGEVHQRLQVLALQQQHAGAGAAAGLQPAAAADDGGDAAAADQRTAAGRKASCCGLSFELPYVSKFLLLAAHVASRNKPTSDRAVFDPTYRKRGRKDAQAHDRQVEAAVEAKLRGPHTFPLERLLHIFYVLYAHHDAEDEEEGAEGRLEVPQSQRVMQQAEVLQQVSSLVALRLLEQCGGDVLEGQLYRCNLGEAAAAALGANVRLRLTDYLRLG
ncbi:hypothetical protein CHLNCDRAFT_50195 [Chlorella variabilis]|uniref:Uncharacterized protein n=1 Tax=Chlorella variabilis TaxID=554065 RepID=E1Z6Y3_CHLVA|nr:hypothetical protein CHLNCDRAFT_50195 [Chlorella variabilis]EFN58433.1 hypothetical protein CHLNCDRAFT_50195 [Chlorella variabilis]|eukprot:XP_005850535.1 hypothetical protein CHLNCDRAFT_50195 [Chlorella variabilis]